MFSTKHTIFIEQEDRIWVSSPYSPICISTLKDKQFQTNTSKTF